VPLVTAERWRNRRWSTDIGPRGSRITAWGVPLALRLHDDHAIQAEGDLDGDDDALVGPGRVGRHYDLPGGHRLIWREVKPGDVLHPLRPFEETPGELDHLAEHGVRLSVLRLASVPENPVWRHRLSCPPGTQFVYQPPLMQAQIDEGAERPRAVVGSYVVRDGDGCKVGHILRPCALSADRTKRVWGAIQIQDGVSEVTFRPDALTALGPGALLFGLDTFGYTSVGGSFLEWTSPSYTYAVGPYTCPSAGTATDLHFYARLLTGANGKLGLYTDASGEPDDLLESTAEFTWTSRAWNTHSINQGVSASTDYHVGQGADGGVGIYYDSGTSKYHRSEQDYADGLPDPWNGSVLYSNLDVSAYVTYTPSGGGAGAAPQSMHYARLRRA